MARNTRVAAGMLLAAVMSFGGLVSNAYAATVTEAKWNGTNNGWGGQNNWTPTGVPDNTNYNVTFDDSGLTNSTVAINSSYTINNMTVSTGGYTFNGTGHKISGTTLSITGNTVFNTGLDFTSGRIEGSGTIVNLNKAFTFSNGMAVGNDATLNVYLSNTDFPNGATDATKYSGEGTVRKNGTNSLTLTGDSSGLTGTYDIYNGALIMSGADASLANATVTLNNAADKASSLTINGTSTKGTVGTLTGGTNNIVTINNGGTLDVNQMTTAATTGFTGTLKGKGGMTVAARTITGKGTTTGNVELGKNVEYEGLTTVDNSKLTLSATAVGNNNSDPSNGDMLASSSGVTLQDAGHLVLNTASTGEGGDVTYIVKALNSKSTLDTINLNSNTLKVTGALTATDDIVKGTISGTGDLTLDLGSNTTTLTLANANDYSGDTTITQGILNLGVNGSNKGSIEDSKVVTVANDDNGKYGTLKLSTNATVNELAGGGKVTFNGTSINTSTGKGTETLTLKKVDEGDFTGDIFGKGNVTVASGTDSVTFVSAQTYEGLTTVESGTLALSKDTGTTGSIAASSGLNLSESGTAFDIQKLAGDDAIVQKLTGVAGSHVYLGASDLEVRGTGEYGGVIANYETTGTSGGGLIVGGSSTILTLTNVNTYDDDTVIGSATENSTLKLTGTGDLNKATAVKIGSLGKLDLTEKTTALTIKALTGDYNASTKKYAEVATGTQSLTILEGHTGTESWNGKITGSANVTLGDEAAASGSEIFNFTQSNTYSGKTTVTTGNKLTLTGSGSIASSKVLDLNGSYLDVTKLASSVSYNTELSNLEAKGGSLITITDVNDSTTAVNKLTVKNGFLSNGSTVGGDGTFAVAGTSTTGNVFTVNDTSAITTDYTTVTSATLAFAGNQDASGTALTLGASGKLDISGYTGTTGGIAGRFAVEDYADNTNGSSLINLGNKTLVFSGGDTVVNAKISNDKDSSTGYTTSGSVVIDLDSGTDKLTYANTASNSYSYTGSTTVSTGIFDLAGKTLSGAVIVDDSDATFIGTGTVGSVAIGGGGTFENAHSSSGNTLTVTNDFTMTNGTLNLSTTTGTTGANVKANSVSLNSGTLNVTANSSGEFTLFSSTNGTTMNESFVNTIANVGSYNAITSNATSSIINTGTEIKIVVLSDKQYSQTWTGGGTSYGVWDDEASNWSSPVTSGTDVNWLNEDGGVAIFGSNGPEQISVAGNIKFDHIQLTDATSTINRTFTGSGTLNLNVAPTNTAAVISVGKDKTATFETQLVAGNTQNLRITGGGTTIFTRDNIYNGTTTIDGSGTVLWLQDANAAGNSSIVLGSSSGSSGSTLLLGSDGRGEITIGNQISDANGTAVNTVRINDGDSVFLGNSANAYTSNTVIGSGATLDGYLSKYSTHTLEEYAQLDVTGAQTIGGLKGGETAVVYIDGGSLTVNGSSNNYTGELWGTGDLYNNGSGTMSISNYDSDNYSGTLYTGAGGLKLSTADNARSAEFNIGTSSSHTGKITIAGGENTDIYLNNANSNNTTGNYRGTIDITSGHLVMDRDAESLLTKNGGSTLTLTGSSMTVDDEYEINNLSLSGATVAFDPYGSNDVGLAVNQLTMSGTQTFLVDPNALYSDVSQNNFFEQDNGVRSYLIEAGKVSGSSTVKIQDLAGNDITGTQNYNIVQNGSTVGVANYTTASGVDATGSSVSNRTKGVYYSYDLTGIESLAGSNNVVIDSTSTATTNYNTASRAAIAASRAAAQNLTAKLYGAGGFTFIGDENITLSSTENAYKGGTIINMDSSTLGVTAAANSVLGTTSNLNIQKGGFNLAGYDQTVGAVNNAATDADNTWLTLGSGSSADKSGDLTIAGTSAGAFYGRVDGYGNIVKNGAGSQTFSNASNSLYGDIDMNNGFMSWAGALSGGVDVDGGEFRQANSNIGGSVDVGYGGTISGYGSIGGDLTIGTGGTYLVTMTNNNDKLDTTTVTNGKVVFEENSNFEFDNSAKAYMLANPTDSNVKLIDTSDLTINNNSWYDNGVITYDLGMGILGTAHLSADSNGITFESLDAPTDYRVAMRDSWNNEGIGIWDVLDRSNIGDVAYNTVVDSLLSNSSAIANNKVVNARYANASVIGHTFEKGKYSSIMSKKEILSMLNYDSGYSATLAVNAALDTARSFVGQGIKNRINNLRAARTIMSESMPYGGFMNYGAPAYGMQPVGAYASTIVQDTFGYAPGYLGTEYFGGYGQPAGFQPGYGYAQQPAVAQGGVGGGVIGGGPGGGMYSPSSTAFNIWAGGVGNWSKQKTSKGGIGGYTYDAGGVMVGADMIAGNFVLGTALGYSRGSLEDKEAISSDSKIDAYSANLYADYGLDSGVNVMAFGGYTWFDNDIKRTVAGYRDNNGVIVSDHGSERSDYKGHAWYVGAGVSYDWIPTDRITVTPSVGVEYYDARSKSHTRELRRTSGVVLSDKVSSIHNRSLTAPVDVAVTYDVVRRWDSKLSVMGNVGYAFEFNNKGSRGSLVWNDVANAPTINIDGRKPGRSGWNAGAGARFQKKCLSFDVKYDYYRRSDLTSHRVGANVGWEF